RPPHNPGFLTVYN
uniref:Cryptide Pep-15 n=1 Tax=Tityus obscurus TaxID=1221240 RepID=CRY15_TITOB